MAATTTQIHEVLTKILAKIGAQRGSVSMVGSRTSISTANLNALIEILVTNSGLLVADLALIEPDIDAIRVELLAQGVDIDTLVTQTNAANLSDKLSIISDAIDDSNSELVTIRTTLTAIDTDTSSMALDLATIDADTSSMALNLATIDADTSLMVPDIDAIRIEQIAIGVDVAAIEINVDAIQSELLAQGVVQDQASLAENVEARRYIWRFQADYGCTAAGTLIITWAENAVTGQMFRDFQFAISSGLGTAVLYDLRINEGGGKPEIIIGDLLSAPLRSISMTRRTIDEVANIEQNEHNITMTPQAFTAHIVGDIITVSIQAAVNVQGGGVPVVPNLRVVGGSGTFTETLTYADKMTEVV